jgi:hypothetical protein
LFPRNRWRAIDVQEKEWKSSGKETLFKRTEAAVAAAFAPTRALANDLLGRLNLPLATLHLSLAIKTRDLNIFDPGRPAAILITTPESTYPLLTGYALVFANLRAIILEELHLLDGTPRRSSASRASRREIEAALTSAEAPTAFATQVNSLSNIPTKSMPDRGVVNWKLLT